MLDLSISEAAELLRQKKISPVELTKACLDRIESLNPVLNAFITVTDEAAMAQAATADTGAYVEDRFALERVRRTVNEVFAEVDLLITPTTPVPPRTIEEASKMAPSLAGEVWLRNTRPFNCYGLPTISIPCGFTNSGLPLGLQIAGPRFAEGRVLAFAHAFEQATDWHQRTPTLAL